MNVVSGLFQEVTGFANQAQLVSVGSCVMSNSLTSSAITVSPLDAGSAITLGGPAGSLIMPGSTSPGQPTRYAPSGDGVPASFVPFGGTYTFDNGSGGKDVQHFNTTVSFPQAFDWTNESQIGLVNRSQGVTVTWTGGAAASYVEIAGVAGLTGISANFRCLAPVSAGQFTVPVPVLLALPGGGGQISVGPTSAKLFSSPGLDLGIASGRIYTIKTLGYN